MDQDSLLNRPTEPIEIQNTAGLFVNPATLGATPERKKISPVRAIRAGEIFVLDV